MKDLRRIGIIVGGLAILALVGVIVLSGGLPGSFTTPVPDVAQRETPVTEVREPFLETYIEFNIDVEKAGENVRATVVHHCTFTESNASQLDVSFSSGSPARPIEDCTNDVPAIARFEGGGTLALELRYGATELIRALDASGDLRSRTAVADTDEERVWFERSVFEPERWPYAAGTGVSFGPQQVGTSLDLRLYWSPKTNDAPSFIVLSEPFGSDSPVQINRIAARMADAHALGPIIPMDIAAALKPLLLPKLQKD